MMLNCIPKGLFSPEISSSPLKPLKARAKAGGSGAAQFVCAEASLSLPRIPRSQCALSAARTNGGRKLSAAFS